MSVVSPLVLSDSMRFRTHGCALPARRKKKTVLLNKKGFWAILGSVVVLDFAAKLAAVESLSRLPRPVLGDFLTLHLVYNPGAAFGIGVGSYSRWVFMALAIIALFILGAMVRTTNDEQRAKLYSLGLICGGAVGNLIDRFRSSLGVVDFIDVGIGASRWPTFNIADMAVTCGAVALGIVLWQEGKKLETSRVSAS